MSGQLADEVLAGSHQAAARVMSLVEDATPEGYALLKRLYPSTGHTYVVGITGPPGGGKSTVVDVLTTTLRQQGKTVGIVAVDPTSPFSGGAILGDRIRMQDHATDPGVFIRSMATRGSLGGLAPATTDIVKVLDAMRFEVVFIETVGTGQSEVDIVGAADTTVIVLVAGLGDTVQTIKAGIMEIGDVFVINKADQGDADRTVAEVKMMLGLKSTANGWHPPVLTTVATTGAGVSQMLAAVEDHRHYLERHHLLEDRRRQRRRAEILRIVELQSRDRALEIAARSGRLDELVERVYRGELDPYTAAAQVLGGG